MASDNGAVIRSLMASVPTTTPILELIRLESSLSSGTFGALKFRGELYCCTLERPWLDNRPNVSCIPVGQYKLKLTDTALHGRCYEVMDVPGRSAILIHKGNFVTDTEGCILLGARWTWLGHRRGVAESSVTYNKFMQSLNKSADGLLTIRDVSKG